jgi:hypothetical protein
METVLTFTLHFQHIGLNLQKSCKSPPFERALNCIVQKQKTNVTFTFYLYAVSALEGHMGMDTSRLAYTRIQRNRNT